MLRLVTPIEDEEVDFSITVDEAARILGCDPSTVRELAAKGRLRGHRVGKGDKPRGIRLSLASVNGYKRRHALAVPIEEEAAPAPMPRRSSSPAHREALARARARGLL